MEFPIQTRRHHTIQDQENKYVMKGKSNLGVPVRRQGLAVRGALGDMNTNVPIQTDVSNGKVAVAAAEYDKQAALAKCPLRKYGHVQSKIDTGLASKPIQPKSRPTLRREESTAGLAARATARTKATLKDSTNNPINLKIKDSTNAGVTKKGSQDTKKPARLPTLKEQPKAKETKTLKPILKDPTESMGKLKLVESCTYKRTSLSAIIQLPDDIEDIDAADKNSPLLLAIYIKDIYKYLTELEEIYPIEPDHLRKQAVITGKMRATLIDWLVEVQQQFSLILETFQLTVGIIDRYLQAVPNVQRNRLQLIGVTAMYIASKYEEIYAPDVGDFVYVTDNAYSKLDVFQCEREILSKLGFCLARPIPLSFLRRFVKAAHGTSKHHHLAKYLIDLCLVEYSMAHHRPSELAAAALCLSLHLLSSKKLHEVWTPTMSYYSEYSLDHIKPIIRKIARIVMNVHNSKHQAVYNKYLDATLAKVSSLPQLKGETILALTQPPSPGSDC